MTRFLTVLLPYLSDQMPYRRHPRTVNSSVSYRRYISITSFDKQLSKTAKNYKQKLSDYFSSWEEAHCLVMSRKGFIRPDTFFNVYDTAILTVKNLIAGNILEWTKSYKCFKIWYSNFIKKFSWIIQKPYIKISCWSYCVEKQTSTLKQGYIFY